MARNYLTSVTRLAEIISVNYEDGVAFTRWLDEGQEVGPTIPIPHPMANKGGSGIFVGIKIGTLVALSMASYQRWIPVNVIPIRAYYGTDVSDIPEAHFDDIGFPVVSEGEVVLQGPTGGLFILANDESIILENEYDEGFIYSGKDDSVRCLITTSPPVEYNISHAGINAKGIVRRDVRIEDDEEDYSDFLTDIESETVFEEIGWDPSRKVAHVSRNTEETGTSGGNPENKIFRNPAFIEERNILLESGRKWNVGVFDEELARFQRPLKALNDFEDRSEYRNNALGLSLSNPNELMEEIKGTVVDLFGNPVDINRNIIGVPSGKTAKDLLTDTIEKNRYTIAYHKEINVRKGWGYRKEPANTKKPILLTDAPDVLSAANNARDRSRWFVDIDKEGLTKINIPATSETGNVPLLARYENSSVVEVSSSGIPKNKVRSTEDAQKIFRNEKNQDIFLEQVGPGGISLEDGGPDNRLSSEQTSWTDSGRTRLPSQIEAGTAFHDITSTAEALLNESINKTSSVIVSDILNKQTTPVDSDIPAISSSINRSVPKAETSPAVRDSVSGLVEDQPNAGGRSMHLSLDGSLETSIGANTIDRTSWTLDTAGALVARLGRDRSGRSAVIHADGTIAIEAGGFDFVGESSNDEVDTRFVGRGDGRTISLPLDQTRFRGGKIVIRVRRANASGTGPDEQNDDHFIIIDDTGITIESAGVMNFVSKANMTLKSKTGMVIIDGEGVQFYTENPRYLNRSTRPIIL
jgi:hypothetical protein